MISFYNKLTIKEILLTKMYFNTLLKSEIIIEIFLMNNLSSEPFHTNNITFMTLQSFKV